MKSLFFLLLIYGAFSNISHAECTDRPTVFGPDIFIDLSDKLSEKNKQWTYQTSTTYPASPTFYCNTQSTFGLSGLGRTISFNNKKHIITVKIKTDVEEMKLEAGEHSGIDLNVPVTITFTLDPSGTVQQDAAGDTARIHPAMIAADTTTMGWLAWGRKLFWYFLGYGWSLSNSDMFAQSLIIKYAPSASTCSFDNAGLTVNLPKIGISQLTSSPQPGYTPFVLNFSCNNLQENSSADRAIDIFLSSNNLLSSDNSTLIDSSTGAAKGTGIRVNKHETPNAPIVFSTSSLNRGTGTSIFKVAAGAPVQNNFSIAMGAYYYPYNPAQMTSGEIRATATLNIIYQ